MAPSPPTLVKDDELDPELVSLRRRLPVGPLLVASVLAFALLMMFRLRHDFVYSRQSETPRDLGQLRDAAASPLPDNAHVSFVAEVDAWSPARLRGIQSTGYRLAPFLGTGRKIWIHTAGEAIDVAPTYDGRYSGRLRHLDETAFGDGLRSYVAAQPPRPRFVFPEAVTDRLPAVDVHGDPLVTGADTPVTIEERVTDLSVVTMVATDTIADEAAAARALAAAGLEGAKLVDKTGASWMYEVAGGPDLVRPKLRQARLFGAAADGKIVAHTGRVADLQLTPDAIQLVGRSVPRAAIDHLELSTREQIPADAWVLLAGDTPARLWYMTPLYAGLAVIALLMGWALAVAIRHMRKQRADSPV